MVHGSQDSQARMSDLRSSALSMVNGVQEGYMMTYFHTRDFDTEQPMVKGLPLRRKFKSYVGIKGAWKKWNHLLDDFEFVNMAQADQMVDWGKARIVEL